MDIGCITPPVGDLGFLIFYFFCCGLVVVVLFMVVVVVVVRKKIGDLGFFFFPAMDC